MNKANDPICQVCHHPKSEHRFDGPYPICRCQHTEKNGERCECDMFDRWHISSVELNALWEKENGKPSFCDECGQMLPNIKCPKCGYRWRTDSDARYVSCAKCHTKFARPGYLKAKVKAHAKQV